MTTILGINQVAVEDGNGEGTLAVTGKSAARQSGQRTPTATGSALAIFNLTELADRLADDILFVIVVEDAVRLATLAPTNALTTVQPTWPGLPLLCLHTSARTRNAIWPRRALLRCLATSHILSDHFMR